MEATRFDDAAKILGSRTTRRVTLGALFGSMLGSSMPAKARRTSGKCEPTCGTCETCDKGKCKKKKHRKKRCKKGTCKPLTGTGCTLASGAAGACCSGICRDLQTDAANCGTCGGTCTATEVCQSGLCFPVSTCPATTTLQCDPLTTSCGDGVGTCVCNRSTEGNVVCVDLAPGAVCPDLIPCTSSATCATGQACVEIASCCTTPTHVCLPRCPNPDA